MIIEKSMPRRVRLSTRLAILLQKLLEDKQSWSSDTKTATSLDGSPVYWFRTAKRIEERLTYLESVTEFTREMSIVRSWVLLPGEDQTWILESAEKNHELVPDDWINEELEEAIGRLEDPESAKSQLEIATARLKTTLAPTPVAWVWSKRIQIGFGFAGFCLALFILAGINSIQFHRMVNLVRGLDMSIGTSSTKQTETVQELSQRLEKMDEDINNLRSDVYQERRSFEYSRRNTAMTIRQKAKEFPSTEYSKKRVYNYLADRIEYSKSYSDIIRELARLPEDNAQAETVIAVDKSNIHTLASYRSTVPFLSYPVRLDGRNADGKDFMISSGFGELRPSNLGTGGYLPHMAVDIINVSNILTVTPGNSIVRYPGLPGSVVASEKGRVVQVGYNDVYGWFVELEHRLYSEWKEKYKGIKHLTTFYAHMSDQVAWQVGDWVEQSEKLGDIGNSGQTTGPHLHYEVRIYRDNANFSGHFGLFDRINSYVIQTE